MYEIESFHAYSEPDVGLLPFFERHDARHELARQEYRGELGDRELERQHERNLQGVQRAVEMDGAEAFRLALRLRKGQQLIGVIADWVEGAAYDYEERARRTPAAAPFLASLLHGGVRAQETTVISYVQRY